MLAGSTTDLFQIVYAIDTIMHSTLGLPLLFLTRKANGQTYGAQMMFESGEGGKFGTINKTQPPKSGSDRSGIKMSLGLVFLCMPDGYPMAFSHDRVVFLCAVFASHIHIHADFLAASLPY